jgi:hypothetical protein
MAERDLKEEIAFLKEENLLLSESVEFFRGEMEEMCAHSQDLHSQIVSGNQDLLEYVEYSKSLSIQLEQARSRALIAEKRASLFRQDTLRLESEFFRAERYFFGKTKGWPYQVYH